MIWRHIKEAQPVFETLVAAVCIFSKLCYTVRWKKQKEVFKLKATSTFQTIMAAFPISLAATALLMLIAVLFCRPSRRFVPAQQSGHDTSD